MRDIPRHYFYQLLGVVGNNAGEMTSGLGIGFFSPYGDTIQKELGTTKELIDWSITLATIGNFAGCFFGGKLGDILGRNRGQLTCLFLSVTGWLVVGGAVHPAMLPIGRLLHGFGEGMFNVIAIMYIGEIALPDYKGSALVGITLSYYMGVAIAYIFGLIFSWRLGAVITASFSLAGIVSLMFLPESPDWLKLKGRDMEAAVALAKLQNVTARPISLSSDIKTNNSSLENHKNQALDEKRELCSVGVVVPCIVPPLLLLLAPISGSYSISFFAIQMTSSMGLQHTEYVSLAITVIRIFGAVLSIFAVQRFGRRKPMLLSVFLLTTCTLFMSLVLLAKDQGWTNSDVALNWGLIILMLVSMFVNGMGVAPIPWIICGEWPEMKHKALVNTFGSIAFYVAIFLSARMTNILQNTIGMFGLFCLFTIISAIYMLVVFCAVPETDGQTHKQFMENRNKSKEATHSTTRKNSNEEIRSKDFTDFSEPV